MRCYFSVVLVLESPADVVIFYFGQIQVSFHFSIKIPSLKHLECYILDQTLEPIRL